LQTDERLMEQVAQGDLEAFRLLMERWEGAAKRYAYRVFGDYQAAEDAAQETFVRLFRAAGRYEPTAKFSTYFYTVLGNLCRDRLRVTRRRAARGEVTEDAFVLDEFCAGSAADDPRRRAEAREDRQLVRRVVAELPEKLMHAVSLREFEGLSYQEIADVMDANLGEVKTWIHRGRKKLAERLRAAIARETSDAGSRKRGETGL
jgi:RNA polymerase sigma-70 factor (ECF subfamily)